MYAGIYGCIAGQHGKVPPVAIPPIPGTFVLTTPLPSAIIIGNVHLMQNGKVLIPKYSSSEDYWVFNPSNETYQAVPNPGMYYGIGMVYFPSNGKMLFRGQDNGNTLCSFFDMTTNTWTVTSPSNSINSHGAPMFLLANGNILSVISGNNAYCEEFRVSDQLWWPSAAISPYNRQMSYAVQLNTQEVIVEVAKISGVDTLRYNLSNTWINAGAKVIEKWSGSLVTLTNGKVLSIGGYTLPGFTPTTECELFDPSTNTWSTTGSLPVLRSASPGSAFALPNNKVLLLPESDQTTCYLYDYVTGLWTLTNPTLMAKTAYSATALSDGRVYIGGGSTNNGFDPTGESEIFSL